MATNEVKNRMIENVKNVVAAPSCCAELKAVAEEWLQAVDTDKEAEVSVRLITELEEDVCTLDDVIPFFSSPRAVEFFGEAGAKAQLEAAEKAKAEGGKYCLCPACQAGAAILADKEALLGN